ncbi:MAG: ribosome assembly RNA-binding protein YhbY [Peptococcaceae bacterium]|nr:ribosome assembly RNA-binding protein YhbY [Peptococcaceae bacterium]
MLSGKEKRYLRSLANTIDPVVQVGKASVNESVLFSLNEALEARELVKAKVLKNCLDEVKDVAQELADQSNAELVQVIGRNVVLYRRNPEKPMIELPKK